jgi:SAM-dependent methyltransferase
MKSKEMNTLRNSAHLYDYDNRDNLTADIPFYLSYGEYAKEGVLELGCGTGRVAIPLAESGYGVTGLDLSENMLSELIKKLRKKPEEIKQRIKLIKGDMSDFSLDRRFGLIISPFRAFQSLTDDRDINNCLKCIYEHLSYTGVLILNAFRPYALLDESWIYPERIQWERTDEASGIRIVKKHGGEKIDVKKQIIYPYFAFEITHPDGNIERIIDKLALKYYYYEQLKELLLNNGFFITEEYGWYDKSGIEGGRELIFVCRRSKE